MNLRVLLRDWLNAPSKAELAELERAGEKTDAVLAKLRERQFVPTTSEWTEADAALIGKPCGYGSQGG